MQQLSLAIDKNYLQQTKFQKNLILNLTLCVFYILLEARISIQWAEMGSIKMNYLA